MNDTETLIMQAMERSELFAAQVATEHRQAFSSQMREKFGADEIVLDEPYLPFLLVRAQLRYLRRMAKLEQRLQEVKAAPLYPDCCASYKDNDVSVPAQIEAETNRAAIEAKQDMDSTRQQTFGVKGYIWRADGESCPVCAPRDGKIFTWGEGEAPGSIHPNCNCFAEPVAEGAGDSTPPRITGADIADMALLLASLIPAVRASRIGSAAVRGLGRVGQRVLDRARGNEKPPEAPKPAAKPKPDVTKRPEGVPKDWEARSVGKRDWVVHSIAHNHQPSTINQ